MYISIKMTKITFNNMYDGIDLIKLFFNFCFGTSKKLIILFIDLAF